MVRIQPGRMDATLVAGYGGKPPPLAGLLTSVQGELKRCFAGAFEPYALAQVHGTIIGLEGVRSGGGVLNANYLRQRREERPIDFKGVFELLRDAALLPFTVRIGGYRKGEPFPFTSRGEHPYLRSFSIQGDAVVAIAWPVDDAGYPPALDRLRRAFNKVNVLHKYHSSDDDIDNDFFFILGRIDRSGMDEGRLRGAQERMRVFLAARDEVIVPISRDNMAVLLYVDERLPTDSTRVYTLHEAEAGIDEIVSAYREAEV